MTLKFAEAEWAWMNDVIADARKQDRAKIIEAHLIREAIYQLAQRGGWVELRETILRRRKIERSAGRQPGPPKR